MGSTPNTMHGSSSKWTLGPAQKFDLRNIPFTRVYPIYIKQRAFSLKWGNRYMGQHLFRTANVKNLQNLCHGSKPHVASIPACGARFLTHLTPFARLRQHKKREKKPAITPQLGMPSRSQWMAPTSHPGCNFLHWGWAREQGEAWM